MLLILGILAGVLLPIQTSVNTRLRGKVHTSYNASLVSFTVGFLFMLALCLISGQRPALPFAQLAQAPFWIWMGGICGVCFLTGNIILLARIGSVQTVIFPVLGQILMGLMIDHFGLFYAAQAPLTFLRVIGALLVISGVVIVSLAQEKQSRRAAAENTPGATPQPWLWRMLGILTGTLCAMQTAINGCLGKVAGNPIFASTVSFGTGMAILVIVCILMRCKGSAKPSNLSVQKKHPWWIWIGGLLGSTCVLANIYLSSRIGTGMTIITFLIGSTAGGLLIDQFGWFQVPKKPINAAKLLGVLIMAAGAAVIKLF